MQISTLPGVSIKNVLVAAIGGQGGNVLVEWLFLAAEKDGRRAQALSLPGLSQRGGGTTFYLEIASLENSGPDPRLNRAALDKAVFAQFPFPGRVDVLVGQELVELGRLLQDGFASSCTTVVASSQRIFTIDEKMPAFDGVFPAEKIVEAAHKLAGKVSIIDTSKLAAETGLGELATNAILLGVFSAIDGTLPIPAERYREAIRDFGLAVDMNLKAFETGRIHQLKLLPFERKVFSEMEAKSNRDSSYFLQDTLSLPLLTQGNNLTNLSGVGDGAADSGSQLKFNPPASKKVRRSINLTPIVKGPPKPEYSSELELVKIREKALLPAQRGSFTRMATEIMRQWDPSLHSILVEAIYQLIDYQDTNYAELFLNQTRPIYNLDLEHQEAENAAGRFLLTRTFAKNLAIRMTYEDAVRVAYLKIKPGRIDRIRQEMNVKPGQVLHVTDYLKPDMAEIYGIFPDILVRPLLFLGKISGIGLFLATKHLSFQQHLQTTTIKGFLTFRFLTLFKTLRPLSYRFKQEWKGIKDYTSLVLEYSSKDYDLGIVVAESGRLIKGYGDTRRKMVKTVERLYSEVLTPVSKWEEKVKLDSKRSLEGLVVTLKAVQSALRLVGRSDKGIDQAEAIVNKILAEAKHGRTRDEMLNQSDIWI